LRGGHSRRLVQLQDTCVEPSPSSRPPQATRAALIVVEKPNLKMTTNAALPRRRELAAPPSTLARIACRAGRELPRRPLRRLRRARSPQWSRAHSVGRPLVVPHYAPVAHTRGGGRELAAQPSAHARRRSPRSPLVAPLYAPAAHTRGGGQELARAVLCAGRPLHTLAKLAASLFAGRLSRRPGRAAAHARNAGSLLAALLSVPAARARPCSAGSQFAAPPSVPAAHARFVAVRASHARSPPSAASPTD
jgi:hypothetical protein